MDNRITKLFATQPHNVLSVYYTAGFPKLDDTVSIAEHIGEAGADVIEIGIPFSDPIADGPVIQDSNKIALDNGMSVKVLLGQVRLIRKKVKLPIILMGYLNPVIQYGLGRFCKEAAESGVDGLILPDMPIHEYENNYKVMFESHGLSNVFLISPTTSETRIRKMDEATRGFIYAVSSTSTTGAKAGFSAEQTDYFGRLKNMKLKNQILIGFGISNSQAFSSACQFAAGAIVGSAFITMLKDSADLKTDISKFVKDLRTTI